MKEENMFENLFWEMYVLETTAQCVRQNALRAIIFSLIFSFTIDDVTKIALFGRKMLNWKKTRKKERE